MRVEVLPECSIPETRHEQPVRRDLLLISSLVRIRRLDAATPSAGAGLFVVVVVFLLPVPLFLFPSAVAAAERQLEVFFFVFFAHLSVPVNLKFINKLADCKKRK